MLMMRVTPKMSESPAPTKNRLEAAASPLSAWKRRASRLMGRRSRGVLLRGARGRAAKRLPLHLHHLMRRHHILAEVIDDPQRSADHQRDDEHAEGQRHNVVGVVGSRVDVQEEN